jgi:endonuclease YncB( thermonuclease family)
MRRMFQLASGQQVTCRLHGRKSYDREIGECQLADGRDLSTVMIREGSAGDGGDGLPHRAAGPLGSHPCVAIAALG